MESLRVVDRRDSSIYTDTEKCLFTDVSVVRQGMYFPLLKSSGTVENVLWAHTSAISDSEDNIYSDIGNDNINTKTSSW